MSKDRARPFSRKHLKYWIPVTGGMILIGLVNVAIGFYTYTPAPEYPTPGTLRPATGCAPAITARVAADMPGATITECTPERSVVMRGERRIELETAGDEIRGIAETLTLPEIPAEVMRAFAIAHPRTIPAGAIKRTRRGGEPTYELAFPPGAAHATAVLRGDGTVVELR